MTTIQMCPAYATIDAKQVSTSLDRLAAARGTEYKPLRAQIVRAEVHMSAAVALARDAGDIDFAAVARRGATESPYGPYQQVAVTAWLEVTNAMRAFNVQFDRAAWVRAPRAEATPELRSDIAALTAVDQLWFRPGRSKKNAYAPALQLMRWAAIDDVVRQACPVDVELLLDFELIPYRVAPVSFVGAPAVGRPADQVPKRLVSTLFT